MQKQQTSFLGIDVSKLTLDVSLMHLLDHQKQDMSTQRFDNDPQGLKALHQWLKTAGVALDESALLVIENTGVYHRLLWQYCTTQGLPLHIGNATHIKWSFGIARGKNDRIDSQRLCLYAYRHRDELKASAVLDAVLLELKDLVRARDRLKGQSNSIKVYLQELKASNSKEVQKLLEQAHQAALQGLIKSLEQVQRRIDEIVQTTQGIQATYKLLLSVPGIGQVTAVYLMCCTNNFATKISGKQLASYAGLAPFEHRSGTSVKGRSRVHRMGNKTLKRLLHMGARSVVRHNAEMKEYYERKAAQGKHHMHILNAIKNKMVLRVASVVNNQRAYVDKYNKAG